MRRALLAPSRCQRSCGKSATLSGEVVTSSGLLHVVAPRTRSLSVKLVSPWCKFNPSSLPAVQLGASRGKTFKAGSDERIALLIDGDSIGPKHWPGLIDAVSSRGKLVCAHVFDSPREKLPKSWQQTAASLGITFKDVPRRHGGAKDPNDLSIGMHAARLVCQGDASTIALAVHDIDFTYVAQLIREWGFSTIALIPKEMPAVHLAKSFEHVGAEVVRYEAKELSFGLPKFKNILQQDGTSYFEEFSWKMNIEQCDTASLAEQLLALKYIQAATDPLVPGLAKLYHSNAMGPLTVYPDLWGLSEALTLLDKGRLKSCSKKLNDLIFVSPKSTVLKSDQNRYGSAACGQVVRGGGAFIVQDSEEAPTDVLTKLGYLDTRLNSDLGEAINVFCSMGRNAKTLTSIGLDILSADCLKTKQLMLRQGLLSTKHRGHWQTPPNDTLVRKHLASAGLILGDQAEASKVAHAMESYCKKHNLQQKTTYNGLVIQIQSYLTKADPRLRK